MNAVSHDKFPCILNPSAGGGKVGRMWPTILARGNSLGLKLSPHFTTEPQHATRLTRQLAQAGATTVVAIGGDGTVNEVATGLLQLPKTARPALAVLPLGSGDDFARGLGLSGISENGLHPQHLGFALAQLQQPHIHWLDAAEVHTQHDQCYSICGLGSGFDAAVAQAAGLAPGFLRGLARYGWGIAAVMLASIHQGAHWQHELQAVCDHTTVYNGPSLLAACMLMPCYGGGFRVAPHAVADDGLLEVVVGGRFSRLATLGILPRFQQGKHLGHPEVFARRAKVIHISWDTDVLAHIDGEMLQPSREYRVSVLPQALPVRIGSLK
jgi:diacylglycerol kinase (ATP)